MVTTPDIPTKTPIKTGYPNAICTDIVLTPFIMDEAEFTRVTLRQLFENNNTTGVAVQMVAEPPPAWISKPFTYGATRADIIHTHLFASFPTWQQAAEFFLHAFDQIGINGQIEDAFPLLLPPTTPYETFIDALKEKHERFETNVIQRTFLNG